MYMYPVERGGGGKGRGGLPYDSDGVIIVPSRG